MVAERQEAQRVLLRRILTQRKVSTILLTNRTLAFFFIKENWESPTEGSNKRHFLALRTSQRVQLRRLDPAVVQGNTT